VNISIKTIPHEAQRYDTCGDWYFTEDGDLVIKISKLNDSYMEFLVGLHELIEAALCARAGITAAQVDAWDMEYEKNRKQGDSSEPGDHANCPYRKQHQIASMIEGIALFFLGIDSEEYERKINSL
jgi:hypothetical protein